MPVFSELSFADRVLFVIIFSTVCLLGMSALFAVIAIMLRGRNALEVRRGASFEGQWKEEIVSFFSNTKSMDKLITQISRKEIFYFLDYVLRIAERVAGQEHNTLCRFARPFLGRVLERTKARSAEVRARAIHMLGIFDPKRHFRVIVSALDDPAPFVAMIAARMLVRPDHPEYARFVLERLHRFQSWDRRFLSAVLAAGGTAIAHDLKIFLADDLRTPFVRVVCAEALRKLNDLGAADIAADVIRSAKDRDLIASCLRLLRQVGRRDHLELVRSLYSSHDFVIRAHAVGAIGRLGGQVDVEILKKAFEDGSMWVAIQAAIGLRELGAENVLKDIIGSNHPRSKLAEQVLSEAAHS